MNLHPKVRAALLAAVATALVSVAATLADVYPDNPYVKVATLFVPVVAGYLKKDTSTLELGLPEDG